MTTAPAPVPCRSCGAPLEHVFVDLGMSPPCEDFLTADRLHDPERYYPLDVRIAAPACSSSCRHTWSQRTSSASTPTTRRTRTVGWSTRAGSSTRLWIAFGLGPVASRRGREQRRLSPPALHGPRHPGLGIEPARNIAAAAAVGAASRRSPSSSAQVAADLVERDGPADLVVANNVFAHVPDLNDFTAGYALLLAPVAC